MDIDALNDEQWSRIEPFVPGGRKGRRGPRTNNQRFVEALIWMARSGGRWRDLPERYGDYQTVKRRYYRWIEMGVLEKLFEALTQEADLDWISIDSTSIRAQPQAAGARQKKGGADAQGLGRSRGGLGTKIHAAVDALGMPVRFVLAPGHRGDVIFGKALLDGLRPRHVIADRAYDAEHFHDTILDAGATPVIPPRPGRRRPHACNWRLYRERNLIERFFAKLKQFRRVATRYDKLLVNFRGFVLIAAITIWLK
nr:IS5 family transposase [Rhizobium sp. 9140]